MSYRQSYIGAMIRLLKGVEFYFLTFFFFWSLFFLGGWVGWRLSL